MESDTISIFTDQLKQYSDVKLIYVNKTESNIKCTIVRSTDSLTKDKTTCVGIIANCEIVRELLSKSNITFAYEIKTVKEFEQAQAEDETTKEEFNNAEIVYKRRNKNR